MESNVRYAVVGGFVLTLFTFIIIGIIWLSVGLNVLEYSYYEVYMNESVSGLNPEAAVEYNGVNVGTVTSIKINENHHYLVELLLKIKNDTPITVGTRARLDVRALSGLAYILLVDKGDNNTPLRAQDGQPYPVIETIPSFFLRLDTALTKITTSFEQLSLSISTLLNNDNLRAIQSGLKNIQIITDTMVDQTLPAANEAISNLSALTEELKQNPAVVIRGKPSPALGPGEQ